MDIVVCVKQVPDVAELKVDPVTHNLIREGVPSILNPDCRIAVEEAVRLKERFAGSITAVSMGPPQAKAALAECIAMGVDKAILLSDRFFAAADTWATAWTLSQALRKLSFDIILCGRRAIDGETGQVGPELAEFLDIPHVTYVKKLEVDLENRLVRVNREREHGYEVLEGPMPILLTVTRELNEPRLPTLKGMIRAKRAEIKVLNGQDLGGDLNLYGLKGSPTIVSRIFPPKPRGTPTILTGDPETMVKKVVEILLERKLIPAK